MLEWAHWFEGSDRHVAFTRIEKAITVSTVFLGLNHQYGEGPPILFETMVFGGVYDGDQMRYSTYLEAELGHATTVSIVRGALNPPTDLKTMGLEMNNNLN